MREITYTQALREAIAEEMRRDEAVLLMAQDVRWGIWGVTGGLQEEFGERLITLPISENGFCGAGVGAALTGMRPVVEVMYDDFALLAMDAMGNQAAKYRYMCGGGPWKVPVVFRLAGTGVGGGSGLHHSQFLEAATLHFPGLKVVAPMTPADAKGMLKSAIRDDNPVVFFEYKMLAQVKGPVPEGDVCVPIGKANIVCAGSDVTIVAHATACMKAVEAEKQLAAAGIKAEIVDLRTLLPLDKETILNSVRKTGRVVLVEDGTKTMGVAAEIAAIIAEEGLEYLNAPVKRVAGLDTCIPGHRDTEMLVVPSVADIVNAVKSLL